MSTLDEALRAFREVAASNGEVWGDELTELGKLGCKAVEPLLGLLKDENPQVRRAATDVIDLWNTDQRVVDPLIEVLNDPDDWVRRQAAFRLGATRHLRAVEPLIRVLADTDSCLRERAIKSLRKIGGEQAIEAAVHALYEDSDAEVRNVAACELADAKVYKPLIAAWKNGTALPPSIMPDVLREIGDGESRLHIIDLLEHAEKPGVRKMAARALGELGEIQAVEPLRSALTDSDWRVQLEAAVALHGLGDHSGVDTLVRLARSKELSKSLSAANWIGGLPIPRAIEVLVNMPGKKYQKRNTARILADIGDPRGIGPLLKALEEADGSAALNLSNYKDPRVVDALVAALGNEDWTFRIRAIEALGMIGDPRAVDRIAPLLESGARPERLDAAEALARIGDPSATDALIGALDPNDAHLRRKAAQALARMHTPKGEKALLGLLRKNDIDAISGAYAFFIEKGVPDSEGVLLDALTCYGSKAMARGFAESDNEVLAQAGREWLTNHPAARN